MAISKKNKTKKTNRKEYIKNINKQKNSSKKIKEKKTKKTKEKQQELLTPYNKSVLTALTIKKFVIATLIISIIWIVIAVMFLCIINTTTDLIDDVGGYEVVSDSLLNQGTDDSLRLQWSLDSFNYYLGNRLSPSELGASMLVLLLGFFIIYCFICIVLSLFCLGISILIIMRCKKLSNISKCFKWSITACIFSILSVNVINLVLFIICAVFIRKYKKIIFLGNLID